MSQFTSRDSAWLEDLAFYSGKSSIGFTGQLLRDHEYLLQEALWARWSKSDAKGFQYLADCYNEYVRKHDEPPLLPPPSYL